MTLKYVQEHSNRPHTSPKAHSEEVHLEDGELYLGEKPTGFTVDEKYSPRKLILGLLATAILFVVEKLPIDLESIGLHSK